MGCFEWAGSLAQQALLPLFTHILGSIKLDSSLGKRLEDYSIPAWYYLSPVLTFVRVEFESNLGWDQSVRGRIISTTTFSANMAFTVMAPLFILISEQLCSQKLELTAVLEDILLQKEAVMSLCSSVLCKCHSTAANVVTISSLSWYIMRHYSSSERLYFSSLLFIWEWHTVSSRISLWKIDKM